MPNVNHVFNQSLSQEDNCKGLVSIISAGTRQIWNKKVPGTQLEKLQNIIQSKYSIKFENYWDFHRWSIKNYSQFWEEIWNFYEVVFSKPYNQPSERSGDRIIDIEWFPGARLNYAENILRYRYDRVALTCVDYDGNEKTVTFKQLYEEVRLYAAAFKKIGLQRGDRVACYMSNRSEAIYAMLAAASMGAMFGGPLPFYSAKPASAMLDIIKPKFLITIDGFQFNNNEINILERLPEMVNEKVCIEKVIIVPTKENSILKDISSVKNSCWLDEFLLEGHNPDGSIPELVFEQLPFNHPLFINFTSGTTGLPKCLVHSAGTFLPAIRDFGLHGNFDRNSVIMSMHPVGWNVWMCNIGSLMLGCSILLYDRFPSSGSKIPFWDIMDKYKVAFAFFVPSTIDMFEKEQIVPGPNCKLEHLKLLTIGSSPVKLQNADFLLEKVKPDVFVGCQYGATEVIGIFSGFDYNSPLYSAEIQCPALGVDIKIFDDEGYSVVGKSGELVVATPTPSLPLCIFDDEDGSKMQNTYLSKFPNVWRQSDEAWIDPKTGGIVVIGRSDSIIKQDSKSIVPEEIYCVLHGIEEIADSICVAQNNSRGDGRAVLFVKMKKGHVLDKQSVSKIHEKIVKELTVFHIPKVICQVEDIPLNLNGKRMESIVRKIVNTNVIPEVNNIRNPECLQQFWNIPQLQDF